MEDRLFHHIREIIYRESGISLSDEKRQLLENRLRKRLKAHKITSEKEYIQILESDMSGNELTELIDAVSTNLTYFFRESSHFSHLHQSLLEISSRSKRSEIKIWCAAASSGEEPYTIAMTASEALAGKNMPWKILATDICTRVLNHAMKGVYNEEQLQKTPAALRQKYFHACGDQKAEAVPSLKDAITFKRFNLAKYPYPLHGDIDIIFCRNVMIYFDLKTRSQCIAQFEKLLRPGGLFYLGQSENLLGINHNFNSLGGSVYQKGGA